PVRPPSMASRPWPPATGNGWPGGRSIYKVAKVSTSPMISPIGPARRWPRFRLWSGGQMAGAAPAFTASMAQTVEGWSVCCSRTTAWPRSSWPGTPSTGCATRSSPVSTTGRGLEGFALTREARRFSLSLQRPACGLYCRLFGERKLVERRLWLDPGARILIAAKRGVVVSGLAGAFAGGESEVVDGLPDSFLASIDLRRRAFVLRQPATDARAAPPGSRPAAPVFAPPPTGPSRRAVIESFVP
ncbi:MAG: hypothetical protein ACXW25_11735, partial [Rhodospirillales bacterium]